MHGDLHYGPDFAHFEYANPDAPKGGALRQAVIGTFDSFNPFIIRGNPTGSAGLIYDTLMEQAADEPFSEYGLLAETIEAPPNRRWVRFRLRQGARWHDGQPVTADDVIFSFETLVQKGTPFYRFYYGNVARVEKLDERTVQFTFKPSENRELPLIVGQLPVLPKHYWEGRDFEQPSLEPPLGSGPYRIGAFRAGSFVELERVPDYWAKDLPVMRGRYNFDRLRFDFFRDETVAFEAFKRGDVDLRVENSAKRWATGYEKVAALADGRMIKELVPSDQPEGMQGFAFNIRRDWFKDRRVRRALAYAFDFEWSNQALFYNQYTRTRSYFDNSELAARGLPDARELEILAPYRGRIPDEVFTQEYNPPVGDAGGNVRPNLRSAVEQLRAAGYSLKDGTMRGPDGTPLAFEILLDSPTFERIALPFVKNLERIGVAARVRTVDDSQYQARIRGFDFDMIIQTFAQSQSPGNEQRDYWGSQNASQPGSRNRIGIAEPVVDELIEKLIASPDRESLVAHCRALDRVLQWGYYVIPQWHLSAVRVAYWNKLGQPEVRPSAGLQIFSWWQARETPVPRGKAPAGSS
jgi:microcin C transport system substrate-binding protein